MREQIEKEGRTILWNHVGRVLLRALHIAFAIGFPVVVYRTVVGVPADELRNSIAAFFPVVAFFWAWAAFYELVALYCYIKELNERAYRTALRIASLNDDIGRVKPDTQVYYDFRGIINRLEYQVKHERIPSWTELEADEDLELKLRFIALMVGNIQTKEKP